VQEKKDTDIDMGRVRALGLAFVFWFPVASRFSRLLCSRGRGMAGAAGCWLLLVAPGCRRRALAPA